MAAVDELITEHIDIWTSAVKRKSSSGRGGGKKVELYGVKKLRELILDLAVRGLLVPQDVNDEPACMLLEQILSEKTELVKASAIKKQKALSAISEEEKPYELPIGWCFCRLQDLVTILGDGLHGTPNYDETGEYFFVNGNNLIKGSIRIKPETKRINKEEYEKHKKPLNEKTVFVSINGTLGNVAFYNNEPIMLGKSACYFNLVSEVSKSFIKLLIESPYFLSYAFTNASGSTIKNLGLKAMNNFPIALPPLREQHRIVAKVDELMALCDQLEQQTEASLTAHQTLLQTLLNALTQAAATQTINPQSATDAPTPFEQAWNRLAEHFDTVFTTEDSIEQLKQTILQLAVMGKLVPQDPNDEPASVLLERIAAEKAELVRAKKIKKQKALPKLDLNNLPTLPSGWSYIRFGALTKKLGSGSTPRGGKTAYVESGIPFLRSQNIWDDGLDLSDVAFIPPSTHDSMENTKVITGDVLLNITGASLGRSTIFDCGYPEANVSQHVTIIRLVEGEMNEFVHLAIQSPLIQKLVWGRQVGMAIEGLSKKVLELFEFPVPALEEQQAIVAKVAELMSVCELLKSGIHNTKNTELQMADTLVKGS